MLKNSRWSEVWKTEPDRRLVADKGRAKLHWAKECAERSESERLLRNAKCRNPQKNAPWMAGLAVEFFRLGILKIGFFGKKAPARGEVESGVFHHRICQQKHWKTRNFTKFLLKFGKNEKVPQRHKLSVETLQNSELWKKIRLKAAFATRFSELDLPKAFG